jgi:hypothetical protein
MATTTFTTIASFEMEDLGKNAIAFWAPIKILLF